MSHRRLWGVVWVTPLLLLLGCATSGGLGDYVNMDAGSCAEIGGAVALLAGASPMGMLAATAITAATCHVITPKNQLTGYISMPVQSQRLSMGVVQPLPPLTKDGKDTP